MLVPFSKGTLPGLKTLTAALISVFVLFSFRVFAAPRSEKAAQNDRTLIISQSSVPVAGGGKATLIISPLHCLGEIYAADYQVKVSPFFFKNNKGKLAIVIPNECLANVDKGISVNIRGTATTDGETRTRPIEATVTPRSKDEGALQLSFTAGGKKMVFNTSYRFHLDSPRTTVD